MILRPCYNVPIWKYSKTHQLRLLFGFSLCSVFPVGSVGFMNTTSLTFGFWHDILSWYLSHYGVALIIKIVTLCGLHGVVEHVICQ